MDGALHESDTEPKYRKALRVFREEGLTRLVRKGTRHGWRSVRSVPGFLRLRYSYGAPAGPAWRAATHWEYPVIGDLFREIDPGETFYDLGAHTGLYTGIVGSYLDDGNVVAFEPYDEYADMLEDYLEENGVTAAVYRCAISASDGDSGYSPDSRSLTEGTQTGAGDGTVRRVNGDALIEREGLPAPDVMKIDVAGAELDVLEGLKGTLAGPQCRLIYCEVHLPRNESDEHDHGQSISYYDDSVADLHEMLEELGYDMRIINHSPEALVYHLKCEKRGSAHDRG